VALGKWLCLLRQANISAKKIQTVPLQRVLSALSRSSKQRKKMTCVCEGMLPSFGSRLGSRYISCVFADPQKTKTDPKLVASLSKQLYELGCYEISLGDTIGVGTPLGMPADTASGLTVRYLRAHSGSAGRGSVGVHCRSFSQYLWASAGQHLSCFAGLLF
jgi:isopropylmalate/homocitrate/citramalate synthase